MPTRRRVNLPSPDYTEIHDEPMVSRMQDSTLFNKSYTPVLVVLLVVAAYLLGMLTAKVQYLEKGGAQTAPLQQQAAQPGAAGAQGATPAVAQKVDVGLGSFPVKGDKNAKVTIVEFADFQCPFCKQWFNTVEPSLIKDYVNSGKVKLAFRNYAFLDQPPNKESTWSAEGAYCAQDQNKSWEYHDYLYTNQGQENSGTFAKDKLEIIAGTLGMDQAAFTSCLESDKYAQKVASDFADGQKVGVTGTPATFVNGQIVVGAQPYSAFKTLIDQALAK